MNESGWVRINDQRSNKTTTKTATLILSSHRKRGLTSCRQKPQERTERASNHQHRRRIMRTLPLVADPPRKAQEQRNLTLELYVWFLCLSSVISKDRADKCAPPHDRLSNACRRGAQSFGVPLWEMCFAMFSLKMT